MSVTADEKIAILTRALEVYMLTDGCPAQAFNPKAELCGSCRYCRAVRAMQLGYGSIG